MNQPQHSRTGVVQALAKTAYGYELQVSLGENVAPITVEHYDAPGSEQAPFPGDYVNVVRGEGSGAYRATGYSRGEPVAGSGEHRFVSRDASNNVTGTFYLKADGSLEITATKITLNGVLIEQDGTFVAPKEISWQGDGTKVAASTHLHNHAMGPTIGNPISPPEPPAP